MTTTDAMLSVVKLEVEEGNSKRGVPSMPADCLHVVIHFEFRRVLSRIRDRDS